MSGIFGTFFVIWQLFWPFSTIFGPFLNWTVTVKKDDLIVQCTLYLLYLLKVMLVTQYFLTRSCIFGVFLPFWLICKCARYWPATVEEDDLIEVREAGLEVHLRNSRQ